MKSIRQHLRRLGRYVGAPERRGVHAAGPPAAHSISSSSGGQVTARWDRLADPEFVRDLERRSWTGIPQTHLNHNFQITGDRARYWVPFLRDAYFPAGEAIDVLSLGCGEGHLDRILRESGFTFRSFTGFDISPAAVARAEGLARAANLAPRIRYEAVDLNTHVFAHEQYDFIYFFQSLHHVEALEHVLDQCRIALRPGGLLMVNEFVGPSRFQWTSTQKAMATTLLRLLPDDLRVDLLHADGRLKTEVVSPTVDDMIQGDPSEAVRSGEIEAVLRASFEILESWNWGGTLNYLVFENIAGNFHADNPYHQAVIELLIEHENTLIRAGVLPSDFKVYLARPLGAHRVHA